MSSPSGEPSASPRVPPNPAVISRGLNLRQIHNNDYSGGQPSSGTDAAGDSGSPSSDVSWKRQLPIQPPPVSPPTPTGSASSESSAATTTTMTTSESGSLSPAKPLAIIKGVTDGAQPPASSSSESSSTTTTMSSSSANGSVTPAANPAEKAVEVLREKVAGDSSSSESESASVSTTATSSSESGSTTPAANCLQALFDEIRPHFGGN
ncbi:hypothetical protein BDN71DRAFT_1518601 [Pleurotus eryngii]|uniref:Uncharacterized protein n=1 Tax=Pleurotus eryngii TaxID=5323 RepID=A0A9P6DC44_PLEER|nr:hypothetical protein BDN71DRAFT_1518601 [Pleurotus eryngii]